MSGTGIIGLSKMQLDALDKLDREDKKANPLYDRYAKAMHNEVRKAVEDFCRQDEEFAQAVVQGKDFLDCMKAVAKGCGQSLSDLDAYRRAVQFYFPGAEIRMTMEIDLIGAAGKTDTSSAPSGHLPLKGKAERKGIVLDLADFL